MVVWNCPILPIRSISNAHLMRRRTFVCPVYPTRMISYFSLHSLTYVSLWTTRRWIDGNWVSTDRVGAISKLEMPCITISSTIRIHQHAFVFVAPWRTAKNLLKHSHVRRKHRWIPAINAIFGSEWFFKQKEFTVSNAVPLDQKDKKTELIITCNRSLFNVEIKYQSVFCFVQYLCWTVCCQNKVSFAFLIFTPVHKSNWRFQLFSALFMKPRI